MPQGGISIYIYFNNKQIHNIVEPFNKGITMRLKNTKPKSWNPFKASFLLNESHNQLNTIYFVSDGDGGARIFIIYIFVKSASPLLRDNDKRALTLWDEIKLLKFLFSQQ